MPSHKNRLRDGSARIKINLAFTIPKAKNILVNLYNMPVFTLV